MRAVHETVGGLVLAINAIAGFWALLVYRRRSTPSRVFEHVLALSHTVIVGQALLGLLLLSGNHRAAEQLHYVYGLAPLALVVFAYSARTDEPRRNIGVFGIASLLAAALATRAFMTGGA